MNARFWVYVNGGWVKLTLRPGQELEYRTFRRTDEGWDREVQRWWHGGGDGWVNTSWHSQSRDCDGIFESGGDSNCHVLALKGCVLDGMAVPRWKSPNKWQRDHAAEAAGY